MIVKIQQSLFGTHPEPRMLIYDKRREVLIEETLADEIKTLLGDRPKAYFFASIEDGKLQLRNEAPPQRW